uniref:Uncharacterized protein n=1 Tax=Cryptococcus bacillisporus CA1280 TaxID=1296109 RepID=A0A0D0VE40_CRYGA|nr:hypothetical protein I312_05148 [Cryptococcus bacillisporus CA1280]
MAETELEDIMASVLRDYPLHQGRHPSVPLFPSNILPPSIPGLQVERGTYCTLCLELYKGTEGYRGCIEFVFTLFRWSRIRGFRGCIEFVFTLFRV